MRTIRSGVQNQWNEAEIRYELNHRLGMGCSESVSIFIDGILEGMNMWREEHAH